MYFAWLLCWSCCFGSCVLVCSACFALLVVVGGGVRRRRHHFRCCCWLMLSILFLLRLFSVAHTCFVFSFCLLRRAFRAQPRLLELHGGSPLACKSRSSATEQTLTLSNQQGPKTNFGRVCLTFWLASPFVSGEVSVGGELNCDRSKKYMIVWHPHGFITWVPPAGISASRVFRNEHLQKELYISA